MAITGGYTLNHGKAYAGMLADGEVNNTVTRINNTASAIPYGVFVAADGFNGFKPVAAGAEIIGVTRRQLDQATPYGGKFEAQPTKDAGIVTLGSIWVQTTETFTRGDLVGVNTTAGADLGKAIIAADADAALLGATVVDFDAAAGLVQISLKIGG